MTPFSSKAERSDRRAILKIFITFMQVYVNEYEHNCIDI